MMNTYFGIVIIPKEYKR